jgi:glutamine amidotransferase
MIKKPIIVIIDYGMGNIRSISNKIQRSGYEALVTYETDIIKNADKLILPGVGNFYNGMQRLKERNIIEILNKKVLEEKIAILGICLGMQLFSNFSEEGNSEGLGWIDAETIKFRLSDIRYKVPHMGWNSVVKKKESELFKDISDNCYYYFVHSYHVKCNNKEDILATSTYGYEFVSAIQKGNIFGTQFHPEKSHMWGETMMNNFLNL